MRRKISVRAMLIAHLRKTRDQRRTIWLSSPVSRLLSAFPPPLAEGLPRDGVKVAHRRPGGQRAGHEWNDIAAYQRPLPKPRQPLGPLVEPGILEQAL